MDAKSPNICGRILRRRPWKWKSSPWVVSVSFKPLPEISSFWHNTCWLYDDLLSSLLRFFAFGFVPYLLQMNMFPNLHSVCQSTHSAKNGSVQSSPVQLETMMCVRASQHTAHHTRPLFNGSETGVFLACWQRKSAFIWFLTPGRHRNRCQQSHLLRCQSIRSGLFSSLDSEFDDSNTTQNGRGKGGVLLDFCLLFSFVRRRKVHVLSRYTVFPGSVFLIWLPNLPNSANMLGMGS